MTYLGKFKGIHLLTAELDLNLVTKANRNFKYMMNYKYLFIIPYDNKHK